MGLIASNAKPHVDNVTNVTGEMAYAVTSLERPSPRAWMKRS